MLKVLKKFYWSLKDEIGRFNYYNGILSHIPGALGFELRNKTIPKYFARCGENTIIHEGVRFRGIHKIEVGNNVELGVDSFIQASGGVILGNDVMLGPGVKIWSINHKFDDITKPIRDQGYDNLPVVIGDGVWLGANVFVLPGVTTSEGCVVAAGSVVNKKIYPAYSILSGNPCRVVGNRKHSGYQANVSTTKAE